MNTRRTEARSKFAATLALLIDDSGLFERKEWAEILGVSTAAISQWINDHTLPMPEHLRMIVSTARRHGKAVKPEILAAFDELAQGPAAEISPFADRIGTSLNAYMTRPLLDNFLIDFGRVRPEIQEKLLLRFSETCMEQAGIFEPSNVGTDRNRSGNECEHPEPAMQSQMWEQSNKTQHYASLALDLVCNSGSWPVREVVQQLAKNCVEQLVLEDTFSRVLHSAVENAMTLRSDEQRVELFCSHLDNECRSTDQ